MIFLITLGIQAVLFKYLVDEHPTIAAQIFEAAPWPMLALAAVFLALQAQLLFDHITRPKVRDRR